MTALAVTHLQPVHTRRASARRRRRRTTRLAAQIHTVALGARWVHCTPVHTPEGIAYKIQALTGSRLPIRLHRGQADTIASLLRSAHPCGPWHQPTQWDAHTGQVTPWQPVEGRWAS